MDPHKQVLSAVALDKRGGVLGHWHGATSGASVRALRAWAAEVALQAIWAIEGSNGPGRRLALSLVESGATVHDVCPTRTATWRRRPPGRGKSDAVDAEAVARELLAHPARCSSSAPHAVRGRATMVTAVLVGCLTPVLIALAPSQAVAGFIVLVAAQALDLIHPLYNVNALTLRQVSTPDHLLGRVNATVHVIGRGVIPLGAVAGGALGDAIGLRPTLLIAAGGILLGALCLARSAIWSVSGR